MSHEVITQEKASIHLTISLATGELSWSSLLEHTMKGFYKDGHLKSMLEGSKYAEMRRALPVGVFSETLEAESLDAAREHWLYLMALVAERSFPLAHHLMTINTKQYAQEKTDDVKRLKEHASTRQRDSTNSDGVLRMSSRLQVSRPESLPLIESSIESMDGTSVKEEHGTHFDIHPYLELVFRNGKRVKAVPSFRDHFHFVERQRPDADGGPKGGSTFRVSDLPGRDAFAKIAVARVLLDEGALRLIE